MTQQIKTFFHTHQGVFIWNETGPSLTFQTVVILTAVFKSHSNGITK